MFDANRECGASMARYKFKPYRDLAGEWRWRLRAGNNKIVAEPGEGYESYPECLRAIERFRAEVAEAPVVPLKIARKIKPPQRAPILEGLLGVTQRRYRR
jgi:uncharacterized protein